MLLPPRLRERPPADILGLDPDYSVATSLLTQSWAEPAINSR